MILVVIKRGAGNKKSLTDKQNKNMHDVESMKENLIFAFTFSYVEKC